MTGTVIGGWDFVAAAYIVVYASLIFYGISLVIRDKKSAEETPHSEE